MKCPDRLLLMDLDEVLIHEREYPISGKMEIVHLHEDLEEFFTEISSPVMILTHRSHSEADQILKCIDIRRARIAACLTAEDLLRAAVKSGNLIGLIRGGLRKSLIMPILCRKTGLSPHQVAFVDDKLENAADMAEAGIGLAMVAPFGHEPADVIVTFELRELLERFQSWASLADGLKSAQELVHLRKSDLPCSSLRPCHVSTVAASKNIFNVSRAVGRRARRIICTYDGES